MGLVEMDKPILLLLSSFGEASWLLSTGDGPTEYTYSIPGAWIYHIEKMARFAPGRAFNLTKKHGVLIKKGGQYVADLYQG